MSLKTRFGNLGNILDFDNLTEENIYVLDSPVLSNSQFEKFISYFGTNHKIFDCTFDDGQNLEEAINNLKKETEIAVRQGITQIVLSDKNINSVRYPIPTLLSVGAVHTHLVRMGLRGYVSINVQSGECLDTHSFATIIGVGAVSYTHLTLPTT